MTALLALLPKELGKALCKMECAGRFEYREMTYYIFRFEKSLLGKWLLGACGGFEEGETEPCGHTYSEMQPYNEAAAQQDGIRTSGILAAGLKILDAL